MADWTCDSNEALHLSLVRAKEDKAVLAPSESYEDFHPTFTYPIYGEDEKLYGYRDLSINLKFASGSLVQYLNVAYADKLQIAATVDKVDEILSDFIPEDYLTDETEFLKRVEEDALSFKPLGQLLYTYTRPLPHILQKGKGKSAANGNGSQSGDVVTYEVYHSTWNTPGFREYHRRMQLFILLYIEGGSYIKEDEDSWEFVTLFEKRKRLSDPNVETYHFIGYSSLYPFYHFPEKTRLRLSQFVILPPFQRGGHGSELYRAIYNHKILSDPLVAELTVEDPAEAFEDLRDKNDLLMLQANSQFMQEAFGEGAVSHGGGRVGGVGKGGRSGRGGVEKLAAAAARGKLGPPADKAWTEKWRKDLKIAGRQFSRLVEMLILSRLDPGDERGMKGYRLQVKERLYRFNYEMLVQLDKEERLQKLEETFQGVKEDYERILALVR